MWAVLQSLSLRWPWPENWLKNMNFLFLFNLDVWEFMVIHSNGTYQSTQVRNAFPVLSSWSWHAPPPAKEHFSSVVGFPILNQVKLLQMQRNKKLIKLKAPDRCVQLLIVNISWLLTNTQRLTLTFDLDFKARLNTVKCHAKTYFFTVWPWPLTYDLNLQSQPSQGQGRPSCQKSRSKVKRFKQESINKQTDGQTLPNVLSPLLRGW